ncbi:MAG: GNAT family N-acetyltransferase, partial [Phototrophicaceae bacterium]
MALPDILVTTFMELEPHQFKPSFISDDRMSIEQLHAIDVRYYRFMYSTVGDKWNWTDRLLLEDDQIRAIMQDPYMSMYVLYFEGAPAGYIELAQRENAATEIVYLGLREEFLGFGLGKHLLSFGVIQAVEDGAEKVIVSTCNLDGPHAIENYRKRGFKIYNITEQPMPDKERVKLTARQRGIY